MTTYFSNALNICGNELNTAQTEFIGIMLNTSGNTVNRCRMNTCF